MNRRKEEIAIRIALLECERDHAAEDAFKDEPYSPWERSWDEVRDDVWKKYAPELERLREEYKKLNYR